MTADASGLSALKHTFGFVPHASQHHFQVIIPGTNQGVVAVHEHFSWHDQTGSSEAHVRDGRQDGQMRVQLKMSHWLLVADAVRTVFNVRLQRERLRGGTWKSGSNLLRSDLGKELLVLLWAIEDAESASVPNALRNWQGFLPEERWWLYTQTAAATGHAIQHRSIGWRRALRYALTENTTQAGVSDVTMRTVRVSPPTRAPNDDAHTP